MGRPTTEPEARATAREWLGLALLVLPMLVLAMDLTVLFFALPSLTTDLDATPGQALWIAHVYGFLIAGFLITMGRLSDRFGARRLLLYGSAAFAVLSCAAAFAPTAGALIAARALLGVAGATLMPSLFSLLRTMFADDGQRRFAVAVVFSAFSAGGAVGPLVGGALLEHFWWGSVFLVGVPPVVALLLAGPYLLPERREATAARIDVPSVGLSVVGMLAVVYGLQEIAAGVETGGLPWRDLAAVAAGVAALVLFLRRQRRVADPLFDPRLLADRRLSASLGSLLLVGIGIVGVFYLFTQYLQGARGLSPLTAGLWTLPWVAVNIIGALAAPALAARFRTASVVTCGLAVAASGALLTAFLADASLPALTAALSIIGLGQGVAFALLSDLIIASAPPAHTGSAAAAQEVGGELGAALGIAAAGTTHILLTHPTTPTTSLTHSLQTYAALTTALILTATLLTLTLRDTAHPEATPDKAGLA
ncbi:MFS transporter [Actinocorallia sp. API 0066]|uniref:MFS transporter n=1 Tax=Actinocorallia sp. API 0066 TaxID=2896846 RepID=UPI00210355D8|nr:MFS transporter [Actinocorallia sp. API 0066]